MSGAVGVVHVGWSGDGALALLHQSLAVVSLARGQRSSSAWGQERESWWWQLPRAPWPAPVESRRFLHGYLFWGSSKISGSQF